MGSDVIRNLLLGLIAAVLLVGGFAYLGSHREHSDAWRAAYAKHKNGAELYCTLSGSVPGGAESLDDPAYLRCVRSRVAQEMKGWEDTHPGQVWAGIFSGL